MIVVFRMICVLCLMVIFLLLPASEIHAQQSPSSTYYIFNPLIYNPAYAGHDTRAEFVFSGSMQGPSTPGSQKNALISANTPLYDERVGLGASMMYEKSGVTSVTGLYGAYSYKLISRNQNSYTDWEFYPSILSLGLLAGVTVYEENLRELDINNDPNFANNIKETVPGFGFGIYYSKNKFSIGVSAPQLLRGQSDNNNLEISRHYYLSGGYKLRLGPKDWVLNPRTLIKYVNGAPLQVDLISTFLYRDVFELSLGYRSHASIIASTGFTFSKNIKALFYWDYHTSTGYRSLSDVYGFQVNYMLSK